MTNTSKVSFSQWLSQISWTALKELLHFELDDAEQKLFQEMVELQAPPPTPIHPRAIPYTKCQAEAFDGRNPAEKRRKDIRYRPRWFKFVKCPRGRTLVQARNFEGDASERIHQRLTMGCTREQVEMDWAMQDGTVVVISRSGGISCRYMGHSETDTSPPLDDHMQNRAMLRMLKVASRGNFASTPPTNDMAWLKPTKCWFSLSKYLACRYEISLWNAFRAPESAPAIPSNPFPQLDEIGDRAAWALLTQTVRCVLKEKVLSRIDATRILDSLLWRLLDTTPRFHFQRSSDCSLAQHFLRRLQLISLDDMADVRLLRLKCSILETFSVYLAESAAAEAARSLLDEIDESSAEPNHQARKRRHKRKKNNRKIKEQVIDSSMSMNLTSQVEEDDDYDDDDGTNVNRIKSSEAELSFPDNDTSARERNCNTVLALSLLDEVVEDVFQRVGFVVAPPSPSPDMDHNIVRHSDRRSSHSVGERGVGLQSRCESPAVRSARLVSMAVSHPPAEPAVRSKAVLLASEIAAPDRATTARMVNSVQDANKASKGDVLRQGVAPGHRRAIGPGPYPRNNVEAVPPSPKVDTWSDHQHLRYSPSLPKTITTHGMVWEVSDAALDDWGRVQGFMSREQSVFTDLFPSYDGPDLPSSVPAFASSPSKQNLVSGSDQNRELTNDDAIDQGLACSPSDGIDDLVLAEGSFLVAATNPDVPSSLPNGTEEQTKAPSVVMPQSLSSAMRAHGPVSCSRGQLSTNMSREDLRALAIATDPTREKVAVKVLRNASVRSSVARPLKSRDDHDILGQRKSIDALSTYRLVVVKDAVTKARDDHDIGERQTESGQTGTPTYRYVIARSSLDTGTQARSATSLTSARPPGHLNRDSLRESRDLCARSETLEVGTEMDHWVDHPSPSFDDGDNNTTTKDETTTITSSPSNHEPEAMTRLREERNGYRDLCLTLGAEVAKLTNMLASQRISSTSAVTMSRGPYQPNLTEPIFDPESVAHGFISSRGRTLAAMSDAGFRAEHESLASGDTGAFVRQSINMGESDWSIDQASAAIHSAQFPFPSFVNRSRGFSEPASRAGLQSRLTLDIWQFVDSTHSQLQKQSQMRQSAVEKMIRLVNTLWPRAQVKLYGSHVTGVSLPSSDVDFIICLPAVHKNAIAVAPGVLEGRNAINESSQKLLYRRLKSESWIDPRSIKLIERTLVPVIKVSTRETKGRSLQLDITFDSPGHHGLEAVDLVTQIMEELPTIRPLVLVLKQFLITKSLLTAYTGGLSSYCLFLMVARYLQEQPSAYGDAGALLIGFLDFFGNHFDSRTTGMSVRRREYFPRPNYSASRFQPRPQPLATTTPVWQTTTYPIHANEGQQFYRRNSFSDKGNAEAMGPGPLTMARPHQLHHGLSSRSPPPRMYLPNGAPAETNQFEQRISYSFDPLWVEDPLNDSNNVGRNAFRYLQVQRAFSDAHRALVAALEWELPSANDPDSDSEYPLLKCLLQSEDLVFDL